MKKQQILKRLACSEAQRLRKLSRRLFVGCALPALLVGALTSALSHPVNAEDMGDEVVVIVPVDSRLEFLTQTALRSIFGMRRRVGPEGRLIKVFVLPDNNAVHEIFAKEKLHTFPFNLRRIWDRRIYSGTGQAPIVVTSEQEMREKVAATENAIGYLRREFLNKDIKVVRLQ